MTLVTKKEVTFEPIGSKGPGGQHVNRNKTGVRATHTSGLVCVIRGRSLKQSKKRALEEIRRRLEMERKKAGDRHRKARWREAINDRRVVRTYHYGRNEVKDHRTGVVADLKEVLIKGDIEQLQTLMYFEGLRRAELERKAEESDD